MAPVRTEALISTYVANQLTADSCLLVKQFHYTLQLRMRDSGDFTLGSIIDGTLQRVEQEGAKLEGRTWVPSTSEQSATNEPSIGDADKNISSPNLTITQHHFLPWHFTMPDPLQGDSLSLVCLLALKRVSDYHGKHASGGFVTDTYLKSLRGEGPWGDRAKRITGIVSRIERSDRPRSKGGIYKNMRLAREFLISGDEIRNLVCRGGLTAQGWREAVGKKSGWVLNIAPADILITRDDGKKWETEHLRNWLESFFEGQPRRADVSKERQRLVQSGQVLRELDADYQAGVVNFQHVFDEHPEKDFSNRDLLFSEIDGFLNEETPKSKYLFLIGESGTGKTALVANYIRNMRNEVTYYFIDDKAPLDQNSERFLKHLCFDLAYKHKLDPEPVSDNVAILCGQVEKRIHKASAVKRENKRVTVFIDGLDQATMKDDQGRTIASVMPAHLPQNARFVVATCQTPEARSLLLDNKSKWVSLTEAGRHELDIKFSLMDLGDSKWYYSGDIEKFYRRNLSPALVSETDLGRLVDFTHGNYRDAREIIARLQSGTWSVDKVLSSRHQDHSITYETKLLALERRVGDEQKVHTIWQIMRLISVLHISCTRLEICDILGLDTNRISEFREIEQFLDQWDLRLSKTYRWADREFGSYLLDPERMQEGVFQSLNRTIIEYVKRKVSAGLSQGHIRRVIFDFCHYYQNIGERRELLDYVRTVFVPQADERGYLLGIGHLLRQASMIAEAERSVLDMLFHQLLFLSVEHSFHSNPHAKATSAHSRIGGRGKTSSKSIKCPKSAGKLAACAARSLIDGDIDRLQFNEILKQQFRFIRHEFDSSESRCMLCDKYATLWAGMDSRSL